MLASYSENISSIEPLKLVTENELNTGVTLLKKTN